jgi:hypothetical protein
MPDIQITIDLLRGAAELERTPRGLLPHRLPAWARARIPDPQLQGAEAQPSGVRLAFRTAATVIELDALPTRSTYRGLPPRPNGVFDLLVDGEPAARKSIPGGTVNVVDLATGTAEHRPGGPGTIVFDGLPGTEKEVEIWLPHNEITELVALRADAEIHRARSTKPVWLHHGSSISQGSNAASPSTTWPALAARHDGLDLVNLGFGGSALLDPFVARVMRDTPADLISVKIGINLVNTDVMRLRAFVPAVHGFLDTIRDGHPDTPLVVISPIYCPIHENTPGPGAFDEEELREGRVSFRATGDPADVAAGKLTLTVIREHLARIVEERADENLDHVDGLDLYGAADHAELPLPDNLHPDAATHRRIAERIAERIAGRIPERIAGRLKP